MMLEWSSMFLMNFLFLPSNFVLHLEQVEVKMEEVVEHLEVGAVEVVVVEEAVLLMLAHWKMEVMEHFLLMMVAREPDREKQLILVGEGIECDTYLV